MGYPQQANDAAMEIAFGPRYNSAPNAYLGGGLTGGGSLFVGVIGVSGNAGAALDSSGRKCAVSTECLQLGLGGFIGGGVEGNLAAGKTPTVKSGKSQSWGFFLNGGEGLAEGGSLMFEDGNVSHGKELHLKGFGGGGLGLSGGVQKD